MFVYVMRSRPQEVSLPFGDAYPCQLQDGLPQLRAGRAAGVVV